MAINNAFKYCPTCKDGLVKKNGVTSGGNTRYRCTTCGASFTSKREKSTRNTTLKHFVDWLLNPVPIRLKPVSSSSWNRKVAWCWDLAPRIPVTGEVLSQVFVDGIYLPYGWCLLVACSKNHVLGYQWCQRETKAAYTALFERLPAPAVVTLDGGSGALSALKECWPETRVQRCLLHLQRNVRSATTRNPKLAEHKGLWGLALKLTRINTLEEADQWNQLLNDWYLHAKKWLNQRSYRARLRPEEIPKWVRNKQQSWFTHKNTRRAYYTLARQNQQGTLFTFLDPELTREHGPLAATTNQIEGGVNAQIRELLRRHRGLSQHHMQRAIEWLLYYKSESPIPPEKLGNTNPNPPIINTEEKEEKHIQIYDTAIAPNEQNEDPSLHIRKGWAGRS